MAKGVSLFEGDHWITDTNQAIYHACHNKERDQPKYMVTVKDSETKFFPNFNRKKLIDFLVDHVDWYNNLPKPLAQCMNAYIFNGNMMWDRKNIPCTCTNM